MITYILLVPRLCLQYDVLLPDGVELAALLSQVPEALLLVVPSSPAWRGANRLFADGQTSEANMRGGKEVFTGNIYRI